jgi:hypothetical protein
LSCYVPTLVARRTGDAGHIRDTQDEDLPAAEKSRHAVAATDAGDYREASSQDLDLAHFPLIREPRLIGGDTTQTIEDQGRRDGVNTGNRSPDPLTSAHRDSGDHPA